MRRLLAIAMLFAACKPATTSSARLEGHWHGTRAEGVAGERLALANAFARGMEIRAKGDQLAITTSDTKPEQARYIVDKEEGETLILHTERDATRETFTFSDDGKALTWKLDDRRSIVFAKE